MSPLKIKNSHPKIDSEYIDQKKLAAQNKKTSRRQDGDGLSEDVVTLSTNQPATKAARPNLPPSQPVTVAEKHALHSTFSVIA